MSIVPFLRKRKTAQRYGWVRNGRQQMQQRHGEVPLCKLSLVMVVEVLEEVE